MLLILGFFGLGIFLGLILRKSNKLQKIASRLTELCVCLLLFVLGAEIGTNEKVLNNLTSLGLEGLILCLASIAGSLIMVWPVYFKYFKDRP